ncbi:hypothetical protein [Butyrivibrio hungatei]|uniref:Uncharacterized protein n=1 Tax=Butyrivibrio hungatei TaxID=185008 RepID=A0A1D9P5M8_9FIRM|nr:hypothetical protein [Butyrivibrio hungatei]AOZ97839.1 hypothetical protein bhn_II040 [Butyrivibrio hungatei]
MKEDNSQKRDIKKRKQTGYKLHQKKDFGPIYEHNEARYPLPNIGDYVIVDVKYTYSRTKQGKIKAVYKPYDRYFGANGLPLVYKVVDITCPEDPLSGEIRLEATSKSGYTYKDGIGKRRVSIGYYRLSKRASGEQLTEPLITDIDDMIAEFAPSCRKRHYGERGGLDER